MLHKIQCHLLMTLATFERWHCHRKKKYIKNRCMYNILVWIISNYELDACYVVSKPQKKHFHTFYQNKHYTNYCFLRLYLCWQCIYSYSHVCHNLNTCATLLSFESPCDWYHFHWISVFCTVSFYSFSA